MTVREERGAAGVRRLRPHGRAGHASHLRPGLVFNRLRTITLCRDRLNRRISPHVFQKQIRQRWPGVSRLAMEHRLGSCPVGEASVAIAVSSPHRREALEAAHYAIDAIKANVPIWKKVRGNAFYVSKGTFVLDTTRHLTHASNFVSLGVLRGRKHKAGDGSGPRGRVGAVEGQLGVAGRRARDQHGGRVNLKSKRITYTHVRLLCGTYPSFYFSFRLYQYGIT